MNSSLSKICVFCGSREGKNPIYKQKTIEFAQLMVKNQFSLVYGAGNVGLMGAVADAVMEAGGKTYGFIPSFLSDMEVAHKGITSLVEVDTMHQRKQLMADHADAFVALPGGMGTMDELCEILTWAQLELHHKPIGLLNINNYYDHLVALMSNMVENGFLNSQHRDLLIVEEDAQTLLEKLRAKVDLQHEKIARI